MGGERVVTHTEARIELAFLPSLSPTFCNFGPWSVWRTGEAEDAGEKLPRVGARPQGGTLEEKQPVCLIKR